MLINHADIKPDLTTHSLQHVRLVLQRVCAVHWLRFLLRSCHVVITNLISLILLKPKAYEMTKPTH
jgi:hypothetical protein